MDSRLFTIKTLAERWGVHPATIRKMIRAGNLDHFSVGKEIRINQETVMRKEGWTQDIDLENTADDMSCSGMKPLKMEARSNGNSGASI